MSKSTCSPLTRDELSAAAKDILNRETDTATNLTGGFPHWADSIDGRWMTTPDGDWTGGALPGILWLGFKLTGDESIHALASAWCSRLKQRARRETAFKGFGFYCGAALGDILADDIAAADVALEAAASLRSQFDTKLGLIPLGRDAEEADGVGKSFSSIDSLQAVPLLFWAAARTGEASYTDCAQKHTTRVLDIHCREDGSIIQSSELNSNNGKVLRRFTHKGASNTSTWGRAQAWGMLYSAMAFARKPDETAWIKQSITAADWWLKNVPTSMVAFWDFDDVDIPNTEHDTAATAIACSALLKLAKLAPEEKQRERYRNAAESTVRALLRGYVTPTRSGDARPRGMLVGGCFNKRHDARPRDSVTNAELIFGTYFLFESLLVLLNNIDAAEI